MAQQDVTQASPFAFFARRWRRQVRLGLLFWRDMVVYGSVLNLATSLLSLMLLAMKVDATIAMLIFFAPMPYNIFLVASVWRTADLVSPTKANFARMGATLWLILATIL